MKIAGIGIVLFTIGGIIFAGYTHYNSVLLQRDTAVLRVQILKVSHEVQKNTISEQTKAIQVWKEHTETLKNTMDQMDTAREEASHEATRIRGILERHDLEKLSIAKPALIETRINRGTSQSLRMFESATNRSKNRSGSDRPPK